MCAIFGNLVCLLQKLIKPSGPFRSKGPAQTYSAWDSFQGTLWRMLGLCPHPRSRPPARPHRWLPPFLLPPVLTLPAQHSTIQSCQANCLVCFPRSDGVLQMWPVLSLASLSSLLLLALFKWPPFSFHSRSLFFEAPDSSHPHPRAFLAISEISVLLFEFSWSLSLAYWPTSLVWCPGS